MRQSKELMRYESSMIHVYVNVVMLEIPAVKLRSLNTSHAYDTWRMED